MPILLAVHNGAVGYDWARDAVSLAVAAEDEVLLWPPAKTWQGLWLREPDNPLADHYYLGARWVRGKWGGEVPFIPPDTLGCGEIIQSLKPSTMYVVRAPWLKESYLAREARKVGVDVKEFGT